jgi:pre-rRNA-processing protein TSR1
MDAKTRQGILKSLLSFVQYFVPSQPRVFDLGAPADRLNAVRALCEGCPAEVKWRDGRAWVLGEKVEWQEGTLAVTGIVRGALLSADRLMHITGHGDYQVLKVDISAIRS